MVNPLFMRSETISPTGQVTFGQSSTPITPITPTVPATVVNNPPTQPVQPQSVQPINVSTGNPALQQVLQNANKLIADFQAQGGVITPEIQQRVQSINDTEGHKAISIAEARTAADNKDASKLNEAIASANDSETTQQSELQTLLDELKTARESYITSLAPTQAEQDLGTRLNTLRTERQLLPIELRQEGISASGIAGRQVEDERVRAIQEQNLLLELGLKQDARKMTETAYEKQTSFIMDDINLRVKIEETLQNQENKILEQARNLRKDSLSAMSDILTSFKGLAFSDLDPQSQADLLDTAKQFNIPAQLLANAMANAKQQQIFENAIKRQNAKVSTTTGTGVYIPGENAIVDSWAERIQNGTAKITEIPATQAGLRNQVTVALQTMGNSAEGKPTTTELGKAALVNAEELMRKLNDGKGTGAVGGSRFWLGGALTSLIPGTAQFNFVNDFNAVKSQLSLEGVKYLKGQGQVSDAERALLAQAVTKLNLSQSEKEFKKTLQGIIDKLKGNAIDSIDYSQFDK